jgi:hypothetical protein
VFIYLLHKSHSSHYLHQCTHSFYSYTCFNNHIPHILYISMRITCVPILASQITFFTLPTSMYTFLLLQNLLHLSHSSHYPYLCTHSLHSQDHHPIRSLFLLSSFTFLKITPSSITFLTFPTSRSHSSHSLRRDHIPCIPYVTITFLASLRHDHIPHIPYVTITFLISLRRNHIPHNPSVAITFLTFPTLRSHSSHSLRHDHIPYNYITVHI